jgi:hypothetical protein
MLPTLIEHCARTLQHYTGATVKAEHTHAHAQAAQSQRTVGDGAAGR